MKSALRSALALSLAVVLGGCMIARQPAPVVQRSPGPVHQPLPPEARPDFYTVQRGDTLYSIARNHGIDYRDLARWNEITNPAAIETGQVLRMKEPAPALAAPAVPVPVEPAPGEAVATPYQAPPPVQGQPMDGAAVALPAPTPETPQTPGAAPQAGAIVSAPQAVKLPYSSSALAKLQDAPAAAPATAPTPKAPASEAQDEAAEPGKLVWGWPTRGKVIAGFNEGGGPKGVQIAGNLGQAIVASAPGRVVYTGSGLRGYGNLVIIKHNDTYLSAYAHNRAVLVKQGDVVAKGQKIAEMGNSDASRVMLHFEIRRMGKPVDPIKFLPPG